MHESSLRKQHLDSGKIKLSGYFGKYVKCIKKRKELKKIMEAIFKVEIFHNIFIRCLLINKYIHLYFTSFKNYQNSVMSQHKKKKNMQNIYYCADEDQHIPVAYYSNIQRRWKNFYKKKKYSQKVCTKIDASCQTQCSDVSFEDVFPPAVDLKQPQTDKNLTNFMDFLQKENFNEENIVSKEVPVKDVSKEKKKITKPQPKYTRQISMPIRSLKVRSCEVKAVLSRPRNLSSSLILVPYFEGYLKSYNQVLFNYNQFRGFQAILSQNYKKQGEVYFLESSLRQYQVMAFVKLHPSPLMRKQFLDAVEYVLKSTEKVNSLLKELTIIQLECFNQFQGDVLNMVFNYLFKEPAFFDRIIFCCGDLNIYHFTAQYISAVQYLNNAQLDTWTLK